MTAMTIGKIARAAGTGTETFRLPCSSSKCTDLRLGKICEFVRRVEPGRTAGMPGMG